MIGHFACADFYLPFVTYCLLPCLHFLPSFKATPKENTEGEDATLLYENPLSVTVYISKAEIFLPTI